MADETTTETVQTEPVRTVTDLRIDELTKRLDALESENRELRQANAELFAYQHPAAETAKVETVPKSNGDVKTFFDRLGIKE